MKQHELVISSKDYEPIWRGQKRFLLVKNTDYNVGDQILLIREWGVLEHDMMNVIITYITTDNADGLLDGYAVLSIRKLNIADAILWGANKLKGAVAPSPA